MATTLLDRPAPLDPGTEEALRSWERMTPTIPHTDTLRGLSSIRLSVKTDETTSPARQREANARVADAMGISFMAGAEIREAEDLDVSASKVGPFDRPQLGKWLKRPQEFDAIVWWRFDRAIRSMGDMHELAKWAKANKKMLVFAEGVGGGRLVFDFRNPMDPVAELMMMMLAFAAQVESQSIKERVTGAKAAIRKMVYRWAGGHIPYGYMPIKREDATWTLVPDPLAVGVLEYIIGMVLKGRALNEIAMLLTADRVPVSNQHQKLRDLPEGSEERAKIMRELKPWRAGTIRAILRSLTLIGWKIHNKVPVRDAEGNPVMCTAEPILTREEYDHVNAILDARTHKQVQRKDSKALLLRIMLCAGCGGVMYLGASKGGAYEASYRCGANTRGKYCNRQGLIRQSVAERYISELFLKMAGHIEFSRTEVIPGYDPTPELEATLAEYKAHRAERGKQRSKAAARDWQAHLDALDNRLALLEETPARPEEIRRIGTGETIARKWEAATDPERRALLHEAGVTLIVGKDKGGIKALNESLLTFVMSGDFDQALEAMGDPAEDTDERPAPARGSHLKIVTTSGSYGIEEFARAA